MALTVLRVRNAPRTGHHVHALQMLSGIGGSVEQTAQQMVGRRQYHGQSQPEHSGENALAFPTTRIRVTIWDFMFYNEQSNCHGERSIAISPTYTDCPIPDG
jgi:hypothetical protein